MTSMTLQGFDKLAKTLDDLPNDVARRFAQTAARAASRDFRKKAMVKVPRGKQPSRKSRRTKGTKGKPGKREFFDFGRWHDNLKITRARDEEDRNTVAMRVTSGDAFWSWFYEKGTVDQPARPVITPLFFAETDNMIDAMRDSLERSIIRRETRLSALD